MTSSAYEQHKGKLTLRLAWLARLELVTVPRYYDLLKLENRTAFKLGLRQFNLQLVDMNRTCKPYRPVNQCKSKNRDNSQALFVQNKWKEGWIKSDEN